MTYIIVAIVGAVAGFVAGKVLRASRHGSGLDAVAGAIGGIVAFLVAITYYPPAVNGWPMTMVVVVGAAFLTMFIIRQFTVRKPSAATRGRFG